MTLLKALAGKLEQSLKVCISKEETTKCRKIVCDPSYMSDKVRFL